MTLSISIVGVKMNNSDPLDVAQSPYKGQCLCGEIRFSVDAIGDKMGHCHCSMCRKFHGAAFATYGEAKTVHFHWLSGELLLNTYDASNGTRRKFCSVCGSSLIFEEANPSGEIVEFALGALDTAISHTPNVHIFVGSKASWYSIEGDLPCFREGRNSSHET
jgi:hypothetical protein